jgi:hypothetical protein
VFGQELTPNNDLLVQLVDKLQSADTSALPPPAQPRVAAAIAVAAQRLVSDYARLTMLKNEVEQAHLELEARTEELNTRESLVTARETLIRLHPTTDAAPKTKRSWWR